MYHAYLGDTIEGKLWYQRDQGKLHKVCDGLMNTAMESCNHTSIYQARVRTGEGMYSYKCTLRHSCYWYCGIVVYVY